MASRRQERVAALLQSAISSALIREVKDPRVVGVTVTGVEMSPDLRQARVLYRVLDAGGGAVRAEAGLENATRFLQGVVGRAAGLRYAPALRFVYDPGPDRLQRVSELLGGSVEPRGGDDDGRGVAGR